MRFEGQLTADILRSSNPVLAPLLFMNLSEPVRLTPGTMALEYAGDLYRAVGDLGRISEVVDKQRESSSLSFELSGVRNEMLSIALDEPITGRLVQLRLALLTPSQYQVASAPLIWSGRLNQMAIKLGKETSVITVSAEHRGASARRSKPLRYTAVDQQALFPTDTSGRFIQSQNNHQDVWPAKAYFEQK